MVFALFSRMQEFSIIKYPPCAVNIPYKLEYFIFLKTLQYLISCFAPSVGNKKQCSEVAMLSVNEEYDNKQVTELELQKEPQTIPAFEFSLFTQREIDE